MQCIFCFVFHDLLCWALVLEGILIWFIFFLVSVEKENQHEVEIKGSTEDSKNIDDYHMEGNNGTVVEQKNNDDTGVAYTDIAISADDVIRAGGLGSRDDISSFLPVAIDSTDFEASLRDARDFEEPQGEMPRPGLGWTESIDEK